MRTNRADGKSENSIELIFEAGTDNLRLQIGRMTDIGEGIVVIVLTSVVDIVPKTIFVRLSPKADIRRRIRRSIWFGDDESASS